jgi:2-iminobutanoate/2-iminopropanoate deaminase
MTFREIAASDAPVAPTYAQAIEVTDARRILYVSGQIPVARDGTVPGTFEAQAKLAWANVAAQITAAGMTLDHLAKVTVFLSDRKYIADYRKTRDAALGGRRVALTTIICDIFDPAWLLEIEAIAVA